MSFHQQGAVPGEGLEGQGRGHATCGIHAESCPLERTEAPEIGLQTEPVPSPVSSSQPVVPPSTLPPHLGTESYVFLV